MFDFEKFVNDTVFTEQNINQVKTYVNGQVVNLTGGAQETKPVTEYVPQLTTVESVQQSVDNKKLLLIGGVAVLIIGGLFLFKKKAA